MTQTETLAPNRGPDERIICALDVPTIAEAAALVARVQDAVGFYKIGLQLFAAGGMDLARDLKTEGRKVFLDWKLHDIGATVEKAAANLADAGCDLLTVHARPQVMAAAARGVAGSGLKVLGVTVLTSLTAEDLAADGLRIDAFYHCPDHPEAVVEAYRHPDPPDRKPNPGMLLRAMADWPVDREASFMIGDKPGDMEAAARAGVEGLLFEGGDLRAFLKALGRLP